jgi:hypothetical protein
MEEKTYRQQSRCYLHVHVQRAASPCCAIVFQCFALSLLLSRTVWTSCFDTCILVQASAQAVNGRLSMTVVHPAPSSAGSLGCRMRHRCNICQPICCTIIATRAFLGQQRRAYTAVSPILAQFRCIDMCVISRARSKDPVAPIKVLGRADGEGGAPRSLFLELSEMCVKPTS